MHNLKLVIALAIITALVDYVWLGVVAKKFYEKELGSLMRPAGAHFDIKILGAIAVYTLIAVGITFFVLPHVSTVATAWWWGALFGFVVYAIYDFTNWAVISGWPIQMSLVDIAWGTVLSGFIAFCAYHLNSFLS